MPSARLVLAAQTNGRKSRGPKSVEGKRRSSANAVKHGFYGKTISFDASYEEDFRAIRIAFIAEYQPQNDFETQLTRNYAQAEAAHQWAIRACGVSISPNGAPAYFSMRCACFPACEAFRAHRAASDSSFPCRMKLPSPV